MNNTLLKLQQRIRGAKYYFCGTRERVYIPYSLPTFYGVKTSVFFEMVNDCLQMFVNVYGPSVNKEWYSQLSEDIKASLSGQLYEIINDCELTRKTIPPYLRLRDDLSPSAVTGSSYDKNAIAFLCGMKVSALFADSPIERITLAIRLAQCRYYARKINKLHIIAPIHQLETVRARIKNIWKNIPVRLLCSGMESLSHSNLTYMEALEFTDPGTMLVVEECHLLRSPQALRSERVVKIAQRCSYKLIMTRSPIVNDIHDVYMQYKILGNDILGYERWEDFGKMHIIYAGRAGKQIVGYKNLSYLTGMAEPYTYAIDRISALPLPPLATCTYVCYLNDKQKYLYKQKKDELLRLIRTDELQVYDIFRILTQLQKIACGYLQQKQGVCSFLGTNKYRLLDQHLGGGPCTLLCKFRFETELLAQHLGRENCALFCGNNKKVREREKKEFLSGKKRYFISTIGTGATALEDLQECRHFIFFSISFKYGEYRQCMAHIANDQRKCPVRVERFLTDSGIDRTLARNLSRKGKLSGIISEMFKDRTRLRDFAGKL